MIYCPAGCHYFDEEKVRWGNTDREHASACVSVWRKRDYCFKSDCRLEVAEDKPVVTPMISNAVALKALQTWIDRPVPGEGQGP